jgi:hypothetical protein
MLPNRFSLGKRVFTVAGRVILSRYDCASATTARKAVQARRRSRGWWR